MTRLSAPLFDVNTLSLLRGGPTDSTISKPKTARVEREVITTFFKDKL